MAFSRYDLCVTADDYGLSEGVNKGIEELVEFGTVTAVSLMMHRETDLSSLEVLQRHQVATGLHLVLVEEYPVLGADTLGGLVNDQGQLPANFRSLFRRILRHPSLLDAIRRETEAQISRYLELGLPLDFINSHQHVHLFPPIWLALTPLFQKVKVPLRSVSRFVPKFSKQGLLDFSAWLSWKSRPLGNQLSLRPLGVEFAGRFSLQAFRHVLQTRLGQRCKVPNELPELVIHPGYIDQKLRSRYAHWNYKWQEELELMRSSALSQCLTQYTIDLKSPRDLVAGKKEGSLQT